MKHRKLQIGKTMVCILLTILVALSFTACTDEDWNLAMDIADVLLAEDATATPQATPTLVPTAKASAAPSATPAQSRLNGVLTVYVLDVGQGDSILLVSPQGKTMLVDVSTSSAYDTICGDLSALGITSLDVVVATHPHADHIGCMAKIIRSYPIGAFYMTEFTATTTGYEKMLEALEEKNVPVYATDTTTKIEWDESCTVTVLSPFAEEIGDDCNDSSIVLRVSYGNTSILLTGDAGTDAEKRMLSNWDASLLDADVLKLGHHGSSTAMSEIFLKAVSPKYAVCSVGAGNDYGHPHSETLEILERYKIPLYRTDEKGTITILLNGTDVSIQTEH